MTCYLRGGWHRVVNAKVHRGDSNMLLLSCKLSLLGRSAGMQVSSEHIIGTLGTPCLVRLQARVEASKGSKVYRISIQVSMVCPSTVQSMMLYWIRDERKEDRDRDGEMGDWNKSSVLD